MAIAAVSLRPMASANRHLYRRSCYRGLLRFLAETHQGRAVATAAFKEPEACAGTLPRGSRSADMAGRSTRGSRAEQLGQHMLHEFRATSHHTCACLRGAVPEARAAPAQRACQEQPHSRHAAPCQESAVVRWPSRERERLVAAHRAVHTIPFGQGTAYHQQGVRALSMRMSRWMLMRMSCWPSKHAAAATNRSCSCIAV
jgi:hypothetical protein